MPEHTTSPATSAATQPLLTSFLLLLLPVRAICRQDRPFQRLLALALATVVNLGRQTISQQLATLGLQSDWSAFYRLFSTPRIDPARLARQIVASTLPLLPPEQPYRVVIDGVQIPRSSRKMPGTSWLYNPQSPPFQRGIHRAQRFVDLAVLLPQSASGYSRAVPLAWRAAIPEKGVRPDDLEAAKEWAVGVEQLGWLRTELDQAGRAEQPLLALADSGWQGGAVWRTLPDRTTLVAGCRANRALFALPEKPRRGRPRLYGERACYPRDWLQVRSGWQHTRLLVRQRMIPVNYRVEGPYLVKGAPNQPLYLLVVGGSRVGRGRKRRRARFWLVNAVASADGWMVPYPVERVLAETWQRWEIEVTHRELKTGFGVGQVQCWSRQSALLAVQWQVAVYSLLVLAGYQCWGLQPGPVRPPGTWWRGSGRWSLDQLRQGVRREVGEVAEYRPLWTRITGNWWEMADWLSLQSNALQAVGRL